MLAIDEVAGESIDTVAFGWVLVFGWVLGWTLVVFFVIAALADFDLVPDGGMILITLINYDVFFNRMDVPIYYDTKGLAS